MKASPRASMHLFWLGFLAAALLCACPLAAQHLTLEGQTGGFLTPTAYVVPSAKGHVFSHPAVGYHLVNASAVIGNVHTVSITEGLANRAEVGYTRNIHQMGHDAHFSALWHFNGMDIVHGKVIVLKEGQFGPWTPGVAVGGVLRWHDRYVSGAALQMVGKGLNSYTNGDAYIAISKMYLHPPIPVLVNFGWKATNASIYGLGGQATRFGGRFFAGLGIPLPITHGIVAVPSVGFAQQPRRVKNLGPYSTTSIPFAQGQADIPSTLDYAVRVTQKENPHFSFDIGIGQVANHVGNTLVGNLPVNLQARHVLGAGLSFRY